MADDPNALYEYGQAGVPSPFTSNLMNIGYVPTPFASQDQIFQNQYKFMQTMKNILDAQIGYGQSDWGNNTAMLPYNLRGLFASAANAFTDPMYGITGASNFFNQGYKQGALPQNRQPAYETWWNAAHGYPNVAAPNPVSSSNSGGGGARNQQVGSYTVPLVGGGEMRVNATSEAAARENAKQGGNQADPNKPVTTNRAAQGY